MVFYHEGEVVEIKLKNKATNVNLTNVVYNNSSAELTSLTIHNEPQSPKEAVNKEFVETVVAPIAEQVQQKLSVEGGEVTGPIKILVEPSEPVDAVTKAYVDEQDMVIRGQLLDHSNKLALHDSAIAQHETLIQGKLDKTGGIVTGSLKVTVEPSETDDVATKAYVDSKAGSGQEQAIISLIGDKELSPGVVSYYTLTDYDSLSVYEVINESPDLIEIEDLININDPKIYDDKKGISVNIIEYPGIARFTIKRNGSARRFEIPISKGKVYPPTYIGLRRSNMDGQALISNQKFTAETYSYTGDYSHHVDTEWRLVREDTNTIILETSTRTYNPDSSEVNALSLDFDLEEGTVYGIYVRFVGEDDNGDRVYSEWYNNAFTTLNIMSWYSFQDPETLTSNPSPIAVSEENGELFIYSAGTISTADDDPNVYEYDYINKYDAKGKLIWSRRLTININYHGNVREIFVSGGVVYVFVVPCVLVKLDVNGNVIEIKGFDIPVERTSGDYYSKNLIRAQISEENNSVYFYAIFNASYTGSFADRDINSSIVKFDSNLNVVWGKQIPKDYLLRGIDVEKNDDGTVYAYVVGYNSKDISGATLPYSQALIFKLDSSGNLILAKRTTISNENSYNSGFNDVKVVKEKYKTYVYVVGYDSNSRYASGYNYYPSSSLIMKLDTDFNLYSSAISFSYNNYLAYLSLACVSYKDRIHITATGFSNGSSGSSTWLSKFISGDTSIGYGTDIYTSWDLYLNDYDSTTIEQYNDVKLYASGEKGYIFSNVYSSRGVFDIRYDLENGITYTYYFANYPNLSHSKSTYGNYIWSSLNLTDVSLSVSEYAMYQVKDFSYGVTVTAMNQNRLLEVI